MFINHPGGLPKPSKNIAQILSTLENCLAKIDIDPIALTLADAELTLRHFLDDRGGNLDTGVMYVMFSLDLQSRN